MLGLEKHKGKIMNVRAYFAVFAVLALLFGIAFVLAPGPVLANYGITSTNPPLALMSRLFGATLLALAVIQWMARDFDAAPRRAVLIGVGVADAVAFLIAIAAVIAGTINALGWSTVIIYLVGAVGAGYFLMQSR